MKSVFAALVVLLGVTVPELRGQVIVNGYDDILFWGGLGANRSAVVVEFNSDTTPFSVAWGYRWSGEVTLQTMMFELAGIITNGPAPAPGSDPRLSLSVTDFGAPGYFVDTLTYDQNGLGGSWPGGTLSLTGWDGTNWNNLFVLSGTATWSPGPFDLSNAGMASINLVDGGWYGWVMANGPETYNFQQPVSAVPEPSTLVLVLIGAVALFLRRRRCA